MLNKIYKADKNFQKIMAATNTSEINTDKPYFYEIDPDNSFSLVQFTACLSCKKHDYCSPCFKSLRKLYQNNPDSIIRRQVIRYKQLNFEVVK